MIFIAGIERSASTWVSNLLDSHPDTEVFMEPLSVFTTRFQEWPNRFEIFDDFEEKAFYFRSELSVLRGRKRWLFTGLSEQSLAWNIDLTLAEFFVRKNLASNHVKDFFELNFHRKDNFQWFPKSNSERVDVVKTLRMNFNPSLFERVDSSSKIIITVRDMASNVRSILKQMDQGNLSELRAVLAKKYGSIDVNTVFKYWRDSYNSLFSYADSGATKIFIFDHTEMLFNPDRVVRELMDFTGLGNLDSVQSYLEASNRSGQGIHNTNRSHSKLLNQIEQDKEYIYPRIDESLLSTDLHPQLEKRIR